MSEPWYESQGVSMKEAKTAVSNSWFCKELCSQENTFESNQILATNIRELNDGGGFSYGMGRGNPRAGCRPSKPDEATLLCFAASNATRVTFETLRRNNPDWNQVLNRIISEELEREHSKFNGFGSHRGFYTFSFRPICKTLLARAVVEMWALPTLKRRLGSYACAWIEQRFAPGGQGFEATALHFDELASASECYGCRQGLANQQSHVGVGGCLGDDE